MNYQSAYNRAVLRSCVEYSTAHVRITPPFPGTVHRISAWGFPPPCSRHLCFPPSTIACTPPTAMGGSSRRRKHAFRPCCQSGQSAIPGTSLSRSRRDNGPLLPFFVRCCRPSGVPWPYMQNAFVPERTMKRRDWLPRGGGRRGGSVES